VFAGETGLLVPPADATALAQALKDILTDTQMRDRLSDRASSMAKGRLSWTSTARRLIAVYEGVLADPEGGRDG
jgi:glycosyltransferase involved in cell wall biosynthesis